MDNNIILENKNPQSEANIVSQTFFLWFIKLCSKCTKQQLVVKDLYKHLSTDSSSKLCVKLEKNWLAELSRTNGKGKPSLFRAIFKTYSSYYIVYGILQFLHFTLIYSIQPILLELLINEFSSDLNNNTKNVKWMCIYGGSIALISLIIAIINSHMTLQLWQLGMRIRIACCSLIYKKIFRLSQSSMNAGQIVNLLSNDVSRFDLCSMYINHAWIMPIQVSVVTYFIYQKVHISAIIGVTCFMVLTIPANAIFGKLVSILRLKIAEKTDQRVRKMAEIISGIQIIKMYTWEKPFAHVIDKARIAEIDVLKWASFIRGVIISSSAFMQRTILFITIISYVLLGNTITPNVVFPIVQYFFILQLSLAIFFPLALTFGAETMVSINRLEEFLVIDEIGPPKIESTSSKCILLKDVYASWDAKQALLKNINIKIETGTLCAIIGPVGSGKSSLLSLLLGELIQQQGTINLSGTISYASQEPWLFASTVRKNILFGREYDQKVYNEVIKACALERDLALFPKGDETIVGERGVSLSGGQRARINMARCVYRKADIYILDDPLSAVDSHVGHHLFEKCINGYLKNKTRILVTHQLQYIKNADLIIFLKDGEIKVQGDYGKVSTFNLLLSANLMSSDVDAKENHKDGDDIVGSDRPSLKTDNQIKPMDDAAESEEFEETFEENGSLFSTLWEYSKAGGSIFNLVLLLFYFVSATAVSIGADLWVSHWTEQEVIRMSFNCNNSYGVPTEVKLLNHENSESLALETNLSIVKYDVENTTLHKSENEDIDCGMLISTNAAIYTYTALVIFSILLMLYRGIYFYQVAMRVSKNLHNKMFTALLSSPMRFFNIYPSGRILNRFSRDMGMIDEILPKMILEAVQIILIMAAILIMVSVTNPYMIIFTILTGFLFNQLRGWFMVVARNLKHLEGIARSPVFSHISASINGVATIRAAVSEDVLVKEFDKHQDTHTGAWYLTLICNGSFGVWTDCLCTLYISFVTFSFIILSQYDEVTGSAVGLAISHSLILTGTAQYGLLQMAQVVSHVTSVERILEYTKLEKEEPIKVIENEKLSADWPSAGNIKFISLFLKYSKTEAPVLKNLNFEIGSCQKIGIVGRTGAGKSSIISALFRLASLKGKIVIDDIDIQSISLIQLRKKISIIPQEPILFSATLRYNLDPFQEFSDDCLWQSLENVELKNSVSSLDFVVQESGSNFSVGQRQLICLARAILRKNKILVLDEATANVDPVTDKLIQKTIRQKFKNCTVLTIAHRLHTIMDADKVMVMDAGKLVEFDHPYKLLQNGDGYFTKMVAQTGSLTARYLEGIAKDAFFETAQLEDSSHL